MNKLKLIEAFVSVADKGRLTITAFDENMSLAKVSFQSDNWSKRRTTVTPTV